VHFVHIVRHVGLIPATRHIDNSGLAGNLCSFIMG
jgi:hypothetical protein